MLPPYQHPGRMPDAVPTTDERDLYIRVLGEFSDMPGLTLTVRQAARLFSTEPARCERVLEALVEDGVLTTDGSKFARAVAGRQYTQPTKHSSTVAERRVS